MTGKEQGEPLKSGEVLFLSLDPADGCILFVKFITLSTYTVGTFLYLYLCQHEKRTAVLQPSLHSGFPR